MTQTNSPTEGLAAWDLYGGPLDGLTVHVGPCTKHGRMPILVVERDPRLSVKFLTVHGWSLPDEIVYRFSELRLRYEYAHDKSTPAASN